MRARASWMLYRVMFTTLLGVVVLALIDHFYIEPRRTGVGGAPELFLGNSYFVTVFHALCVLLTLVIGIGAYFLRCRRPAIYGQIEIFSGLGAALFASNQLTAGIIAGSVAPATTATAVFAELAALYVIARGLDIIHQSLTGTVKEAWEHVFFARSPRS